MKLELALGLGETAQLCDQLGVTRDIVCRLASIQFILLVLLNYRVGDQMQDSFPHVPVRVAHEFYRLLREHPRVIILYQQGAAPEHCLPDHHLAVRELLYQRRYQLCIILLDIYQI
jgi:hypothetical protein